MQSVIWSKDPGEGHPADESITFTTKDSMIVNADFNVSYQLLEKKVPAFYIQFRSDDLVKFSDGFMHNQARECINGVAGKYDIESIMGDNGDFLLNSKKCLQNSLIPYGVELSQFGLIGAPRPPDNVRESINLKVQATQLALQKQNEVAQATADGRSRAAAAQGDADAMIARAKGEAEANRIKSSSIDDKLIQWYKLTNQRELIARWDGKRPTVETGSGAGMLMQLPPVQ